MDEKQAIQRILKNDPGAFAWAVETYQLKALRAAYLITRDRHSAEDVVQDVFLDLPELLQSFDSERPLEPWLMRVVVNRTLRSLARDRRLEQWPDVNEAETLTTRWIESQPTPETAAEQRELEENLWAQMQALSPEQRAAIVMRYYLQLSEQEMAALADVPAGTIKWRLSSARKKLRALLGTDPRKDVE
jgi:RNA polymerase sigma-70 factor, ECF subfamily